MRAVSRDGSLENIREELSAAWHSRESLPAAKVDKINNTISHRIRHGDSSAPFDSYNFKVDYVDQS